MHPGKTKYHDLLSKAQLYECIEVLKSDIKAFAAESGSTEVDVQRAYEQLIAVSATYHSLQTRSNLGILREDDARHEFALVNKSLMSIIEHIDEAFFVWIVEFEQKCRKKNEQQIDKKKRFDEACSMLNLSQSQLSAHHVQLTYNKLLAQMTAQQENAPAAIKEKLSNTMRRLEDAFFMIYPQLKSQEEEMVREAYITLETEKAAGIEFIIDNYKRLRNSFNDLLLSPNNIIRNLAVSEIENLNTAILAVLSIDYMSYKAQYQTLAAPAGMVYIEGGSFQYGLMHKEIKIKDLYVDAFPVTVAAYREYCEAEGIGMPPEPAWGWDDNHPIVNINWHDAAAYAQWVNKRLPNAWEWEYAAQANSPDLVFSGSNIAKEVAWFKDNSNSQTHCVAQKMPNNFGLYDMSGNVWEWCNNWHADQPGQAKAGSQRYKALRGGSWSSPENRLSIIYSENVDPDHRTIVNGFRCVKDID